MKKALLLYTLILSALLGEALFTSKVLSQADVLFSLAPWCANRPQDWTRPANPLLSDQSQNVYPNYYYARQFIRQGVVPLWNPHILCGMVFVGDMGSSVFFPLNWIAYAFDPIDAVEWISFFKLLIAGFGAWAFCFYALRLSWLGSFAAGLIFMLGSFNTAWLFYPLGSASVLLPGMFLATHSLFVRSRWIDCFVLAVAFGLLLLAGHPETAFHTAAGLTVYGTYLFVQPQQKDRRARILVLGLTSFLVAAALSAIQVFPFLEALCHSQMWQDRDLRAGGSLPIRAAVTYLIPNFYGNPADGVWGGPGNWNHITGFAGVVTLFCAAVAAWFWKTQKGILIWAVLACWSLMMVFGIPPVSWIFFYLPLFKTAENVRLVWLFQFCAAVLAAYGIDLLREKLPAGQFRKTQTAFLWSGFFLLILLTPVIATGTVKFFKPGDVVQYKLTYFIRQVLLFYLTVGIVVFLMRPVERATRERAVIVTALTALLFCELFFLCAYRYNPAIPRDWAFGAVPNSVKFLRERAPERLTTLRRNILIPNAAQMYGIYDARGYDFPPPESFTQLFRNLMDPDPSNVAFVVSDWNDVARNAARLASIRYYLSEYDVARPGLRLVYDQELEIYEDAAALPRAYLTGNVRRIANAKDLLATLRATPAESYPALNPSLELTSPEQSAARITRYEAHYVQIEAEPRHPALLVLTDTFFPGWRAQVDGVEKEIVRVNGAFRGVLLGPGLHVVEFFYRPLPYRLGKWLSAVSWVLVLALLLVSLKRKAE